MEPQLGVDYPLELGASLLGKRPAGQPPEFCTLRYDFKPASAGRATQGQLDVQPATQKVRWSLLARRRRRRCRRRPPALPCRPPHPATPPAPPHPCLLRQVSLQMGEAAFAGKWEPAKGDGLDVVAVFDGTSFRLELLGATVKSLK